MILLLVILLLSTISLHAQQHLRGLSKSKAELATIIKGDQHLKLLNNTIAQVAPNSILDDETLLTYAINCNSTNCALALITILKADVNKTIKEFRSPLACSLYNDNYRVGHALLKYGADVHLSSGRVGRRGSVLSQLIYGLAAQDLPSIRWLLENGADPHFKDLDGSSYLHYIIRRSHLPLGYLFLLTEYLFIYGLDINVQNSEGATALLQAIKNKQQKDFIAYLLCRGANKFIIAKTGQTPLNLALNLLASNDPVYSMMCADVLPSMPVEVEKISHKLKIKLL